MMFMVSSAESRFWRAALPAVEPDTVGWENVWSCEALRITTWLLPFTQKDPALVLVVPPEISLSPSVVSPTCKLFATAFTPTPNCAAPAADAVMAPDVESPQAKVPSFEDVMALVTANPPPKAPSPEIAMSPLLVQAPVPKPPSPETMIEVPAPNEEPEAKPPSAPVTRMIPPALEYP